MPAERAPSRATPADKRRVRTGCMKCRKRRRKCDERKPRCENCEAKGFSCEYRVDLSFVQPSNAAFSNLDGRPGGREVQAYSSIKFIINNDAYVSSTPGSGAEVHVPTPATQEARDDASPANHSIVEAQFNHIPSHRQSNIAPATIGLISTQIESAPYTGGQQEIAPVDGFQRISDTSSHKSRPKDPWRTFDARPGKYIESGSEPGQINYETGLFLHYRYNVAPWIDVGDSESSFGITVMLEAKEDRSLTDAVLALAASHRSLVSLENTFDIERGLRHAIDAENGLQLVEEHIYRITRALLMVRDLFSSSLQRWRNILSRHVSQGTVALPDTVLNRDLDGPIFWLYVKIDLATAMTTSQPPLLPFLSILKNNDSAAFMYERQRPSTSPKDAFQRTLVLLARCLSMIFGIANSEYSDIQEAGRTALPSTQHVSSAQWSSLWIDCLEWYRNRPVELQQIVDIRGAEVDLIDVQSTSAFPILIYTTPLALVANAICHITSFLLLAHKPRLLTSIAGPRSFMSRMWHSQSIAGIASAVDAPEQWDPVLVSGLVLIAKDFTHKAQQSSILDILRNVSANTGMNMDHDIETLRRGWTAADYDGEVIG